MNQNFQIGAYMSVLLSTAVGDVLTFCMHAPYQTDSDDEEEIAARAAKMRAAIDAAARQADGDEMAMEEIAEPNPEAANRWVCLWVWPNSLASICRYSARGTRAGAVRCRDTQLLILLPAVH
jgi:hypothetical protein